MVLGLPFISSNLKVCEGCIYGKMHRLPFPKTSWRAKASLQLVHADIYWEMFDRRHPAMKVARRIASTARTSPPARSNRSASRH